jgi:hypothetical protein
MHGGYFVRNEELPDALNPRYSIAVVPWRNLWGADTDTLIGYQNMGIEVFPHTAFSYINPANTDSPPHERIINVVNSLSGWLRDPDGNLVGPKKPNGEFKWCFLDPRVPGLAKALTAIHMDVLKDAEWTPNGIFLDFLRDSLSWMHEFDGLTPEEKATLDETYRDAIYRFAVRFCSGLWKNEIRIPVYGNGLHSCRILAGIAYEHFPRTHNERPGGPKNMHIALTGPYGQDNWRLFRNPPMFFPADARDHAYDAPPTRIVEMVAFAHAFCHEAILFDNTGYVFDVWDYLSR